MNLNVSLKGVSGKIVYDANITHNLNTMALEAGIYHILWRPEEIKAKCAKDIILPLTKGLLSLLKEPDTYKKYNPKNGWGNYDNLVEFTRLYLEACIEYPYAEILISR